MAENDQKSTLRAQMRRRRDAISAAQVREMSAEVCRHALGAIESRHRHVALYAAMRNEVDPSSLAGVLRQQGVAVYYPRCVPSAGLLEFAKVGDEAEDLHPGYMGILEPHASVPCTSVDSLDLLVLPGLAFDRSGNRLGYGGGYYDRTLQQSAGAKHDCFRLGLSFSSQWLEDLPQPVVDVFDVSDVPVHSVATEDELFSIFSGPGLGLGEE